MIAVDALKMLVICWSVIPVFCDVRSDSVRAIMVTLRATATAELNSTVPKRPTSMTGRTIANSIAMAPRQSRRKSAKRRLKYRIGAVIVAIIARLSTTGTSGKRLVLEGRGRDQEPLVARQVRDVESESRDEHLPGIEHAHHDDVAGAAALEIRGWDEVAAAIDLAVDGDRGERRIALHIDRHIGAAEQRWNLAANVGPELVLGIFEALRLSCHDQACGVLRDGLEHLAREEHHRRLEDRKQQPEEYRRDDREFDRRNALAVAPEAAKEG